MITMITLEYSEIFASPAATVFAALTDLEGRQNWQTDIVEIRVEPAGPAQMGSKVFEERKIAGYKSESTLIVSEWEQDSRLTLETPTDTKQRASESYRIEPLTDGTCRLYVTNVLDGMPRVGEFFARQTLKKMQPQYFERLKSVIASRP